MQDEHTEKNFPVAYGSPPALMGLFGGQPASLAGPGVGNCARAGVSLVDLRSRSHAGPVPSERPRSTVHLSGQRGQRHRGAVPRAVPAPAPFTEDYFPTQLVTDLGAPAAGDRSGELAGLRYSDGITQHPAAYIDAGEGITPDLPASIGQIPNGPPRQVHVVASGYNHLDVVTAARAQTDGQPEITSSTLA